MRFTTGAATYSKNKDRFAVGAPQIVAGLGAWAMDAEGGRYVDGVAGLGALLFGHRQPHLEQLMQAWTQAAILLPMASELEESVARRLCGNLGRPRWKVRFSKNGTDATWAAVRLARAVTGRAEVFIVDYHGAWSVVEPTWNAGAFTADICRVPRATLPQRVRDSQPACVMLEPVSSTEPHHPAAAYWRDLREACNHAGSLLILDEMVTWGRMNGGHGMAALGIEPDLWCGAKALGGGLPLTAVVGPEHYMRRFAIDVFHSATFSGERLALVVAGGVLDLLALKDVPALLAGLGEEIRALAPERFKPGFVQRPTFSAGHEQLSTALEAGLLLGGGYLNITTAMAEDAEAHAAVLSAFRRLLGH